MFQISLGKEVPVFIESLIFKLGRFVDSVESIVHKVESFNCSGWIAKFLSTVERSRFLAKNRLA